MKCIPAVALPRCTRSHHCCQKRLTADTHTASIKLTCCLVCARTAGTPRTGTAAAEASALPAVTPAVQLANTPGSSADAAAVAAAPSSALVPEFDFSSFCFSDELSDVELVAGNKSFPAHR